ncbi:MAG: hypothetical protein JRI46_05960 [Deltaproteobacteria bacterium]|nr:hypothetical protein [Deltaproteobacteria bacterium]
MDKDCKEQLTMRFLSDFRLELIKNLHEYQRNFTQLLVAVLAGMAD